MKAWMRVPASEGRSLEMFLRWKKVDLVTDLMLDWKELRMRPRLRTSGDRMMERLLMSRRWSTTFRSYNIATLLRRLTHVTYSCRSHKSYDINCVYGKSCFIRDVKEKYCPQSSGVKATSLIGGACCQVGCPKGRKITTRLDSRWSSWRSLERDHLQWFMGRGVSSLLKQRLTCDWLSACISATLLWPLHSLITTVQTLVPHEHDGSVHNQDIVSLFLVSGRKCLSSWWFVFCRFVWAVVDLSSHISVYQVLSHCCIM